MGTLFLRAAYLKVEIRGEEKERFLNLCAHHGINLWDIVYKENIVIAHIDAEDFFSLKKIVKKTNSKIRILKKDGLLFKFYQILCHKTFCLFFFFGMIFLIISSNYLWRIKITGNHNISTVLIKEFLEEQEISFGMAVKNISTDLLEKELRKKFDEITWVSVSIRGTTLQVEVKENDTVIRQNREFAGSNIISDVKGIVETILVRQGTALVQPNDEVKIGDILIQGSVTILSEDGSVKEVQLVEAKGDIWITYQIPVNETLLLEYESKVYSGQEKTGYELYFNDKKFSFGNRKVKFTRYDTLSEEITPLFFKSLFPGLKLNRNTYRDYVIVREKYSLEEGKEILAEQFNKILKSLEEKGVHIIEKDVKINTGNLSVSLNGNLTVRELFKENTVYNE